MQSASAIIPRFVFSSLLSLVFKVISLLQSFQPLLKVNLAGRRWLGVLGRRFRLQSLPLRLRKTFDFQT
jgi:hypothetical protein